MLSRAHVLSVGHYADHFRLTGRVQQGDLLGRDPGIFGAVDESIGAFGLLNQPCSCSDMAGAVLDEFVETLEVIRIDHGIGEGPEIFLLVGAQILQPLFLPGVVNRAAGFDAGLQALGLDVGHLGAPVAAVAAADETDAASVQILALGQIIDDGHVELFGIGLIENGAFACSGHVNFKARSADI